VSPAEAPDQGRGTVDPDHVADGFQKFFDLVPAIRQRAAQPDSEIEFCVYAGVKQFVRDEPNTPFARPVDGLANVGVALPSVMSGVQVATDRTLDYLAEAVTPSGPLERTPAAEDPPVSTVTERADDTAWLD